MRTDARARVRRQHERAVQQAGPVEVVDVRPLAERRCAPRRSAPAGRRRRPSLTGSGNRFAAPAARHPARSRRRSSRSRCSGRGARRSRARSRSRVGIGCWSSRYLARSAMPGMQKPHCTPAASGERAGEQVAVGRRAAPRASGCRVPRPTRRASRRSPSAWPSMSARQQPHCPCGEQPSFSDRIPQRSRSVSSSDSSGAARPSPLLPFSVKLNAIGGTYTLECV